MGDPALFSRMIHAMISQLALVLTGPDGSAAARQAGTAMIQKTLEAHREAARA